MKINVLDTKGKQVEEITLKKAVFGVEPNEQTMGLYVRVFGANQRQGTAATKTRGDVSGSGAKPWKQKGTGRARVGSKRTPIWRHGGISHGPQPKSWNIKLTNKVKKNALISALSDMVTQKNLVVIDSFDFKKPSTSAAKELLSTLDLSKKVLVVTEVSNEVVIKSFRNLKKVSITHAAVLNAFDVIAADKILIEKKAVEFLEKQK